MTPRSPTWLALYTARLAVLPLGQERWSEADGVKVMAVQTVVDAGLRKEAMAWATEECGDE